MPWREDEPCDVRIARVAAEQDGAIGRAQLLAAGLTSSAIGHRLRAGRLHLVHRGVYAVGHPALSRRGRAIAALLAVGPGAVVGHGSAAGLHRVRAAVDGPIHVVVVGRRPRPRPGIVVHVAARLDRADVVLVDGIPVTSAPRTLLDLARGCPGDLERMVAEAQVLGLVTLRSVRAALDRCPDRAHADLVLRWLEAGRTGPTASELERALRRVITGARLPQPAFNASLGRYRPDALWSAERVVVETDGWQVHRTRRAFESDRARDADLQAQGWVVLRFTWRQVTEQPLLVAAQIGATLARRAERRTALPEATARDVRAA